VYSAEDILARLRERPFCPLRIIASEALRFDMHYPELVFIGRRDLMIGFPGPDNVSIYDRVTRVALVHVVALEDLPVTSAPGNGQQ
jgi:hypothetical protein